MADRDEPSFDPRTWARGAAESGATRPPIADETIPARPKSSRSATPVALGLGGLALVMSSVALWWALAHNAASPRLIMPPPAIPSTRPNSMRNSLTIAGPGDLPSTLTGAGLSVSAANAVVRSVRDALGSQTGTLRVALTLTPGPPPVLVQMEVRKADGSGVIARPDTTGKIAVDLLASDLRTRIKAVRGEMDANSFYSSAVAAGVTDSLISEIANAFTFDFDFQREIKPGDIFEAAFEQRVTSSGQAVGAERLVYASLQTQAKSRALYRFQPLGESQPAWFDGNGSSIARSLMRTPVEGARITSAFGPRMHPVLGYTRMHKGTDFATPVGTPVYASGEGVIDFVGVHGGHGNYVRMRHSPTLETAYAHLSAYGPGITVGTAVHQGQLIALSGNTGLSSGPHLHYEVIVKDEQVDPMSFETTSGRVLQGAALNAFRKERDRIDALRAAQNG